MINQIIKSSYYLIAYRYVTRILGFFVILYVARIIAPEEFGKFAVVISFLAIADALFSLPFENSIIQSQRLGKNDINSIWTYSRLFRSIIFFFIFNLFIKSFHFEFLIEDKNLYYIASLSILGSGFYNTFINQKIRKIDYKGDIISSFAGRIARLIILVILCLYFQNAYALIISWLVEIYLKSISSYLVISEKVSISLDLKPIKKHLKYSVSAYFVNLLDQLLLNLENLLAVTFINIKFAGLFQATKRINSEFTADFKMILEKILFPFYSRIQKKNNKILHNINLYYPLILYVAGISTISAFLFIDDLVKLLLGNKWIEVIIFCKIYLIYSFCNIINVQTKSIFRALNIQKYIMYSSIVYLLLVTIFSFVFHLNDFLNGQLFIFIVSFSSMFIMCLNVYFVKINIGLSLIKFLKDNFVTIFSLIFSALLLLLTSFLYLNSIENKILIYTIKTSLLIFLISQFYYLYNFNYSNFKKNLQHILKKILKN